LEFLVHYLTSYITSPESENSRPLWRFWCLGCQEQQVMTTVPVSLICLLFELSYPIKVSYCLSFCRS